MPKNQLTDPITGQEIAFAHLVLSGTMTDRCAAEAAGLNPNATADIKSKPAVQAYMQERQAAAQQPLVEQTTEIHRLPPSRDQILVRLWEIANMNPEITRGSLSGQVKAISMIVAIEGLIPDRRTASAQNTPAPPPVTADIYQAAWLPGRKTEENVTPPPAHPHQQTASRPPSEDAPPIAEPTPISAAEDSRHTSLGAPGNTTPTPSLAPRVPMADHVAPDTRVPFSIKKNPFARRR